MATKEEVMSFILECEDLDILEDISTETQARIDDLSPEDEEEDDGEEEDEEKE